MKIGVLISSESFWSFSGFTRLKEAGESLGHTVVEFFERKVSFEEMNGKVIAKYDGNVFPDVDVIIVRPNFVEEPSLHQYIYDFLQTAGYKLVNGYSGVSRTKNKLLQRIDLRNAHIPMPRFAAVYDVTGCVEAMKSFSYPVILKMAFGTKGKGVFYVDGRETLIPIIDYLSVRDGNPVVIEEFIEEARRSHLRVFVVGGEIIATMEMFAPKGDVRSNAGGTFENVILTEAEKDIALRATQALKLEIAGVDMLRSAKGPLVMEVNANPGFDSLEKTTGVDVARKIVEHAVKRVG